MDKIDFTSVNPSTGDTIMHLICRVKTLPEKLVSTVTELIKARLLEKNEDPALIDQIFTSFMDT